MKLLGIDYGAKRVGLALADMETKLAVPLRTMVYDDTFWSSFADLVREEPIERIVVGMPKSLRGGAARGTSEGEVEKFIEELKQRFPAATLATEDERFSTRLAHRLLGGLKKDQDAVAAAVILQSYLDRL